MATREHFARALWTLFEPIHAITYFSPQSRDALAAIGLTRYWDRYFAGRAAAVGAVYGAPVVAMFSGFAPFLVDRALPAVWSVASPEQLIEARYEGAEATLRALVPDEAAVIAAADALTPLVADLDVTGRPLSAGFAALALQDDPYRRLWQVAGTLREHRGDGHVIAIAGLEIGGITTLVMRAGVDLNTNDIRKARGWSEEEWDAEALRLIDRGLLDSERRITPSGNDLLDQAERITNRLAVGPIAAMSDDEIRELATKLYPVSSAVAALFPSPNPVGMPGSWNATSDPDAALVPPMPGAVV